MISFDDWFADLTSNHVWYEPARLHHKPETFRSIANKVYMEYVALENFPPIQVARTYVFNKISKINPDLPKVDWTKKALEKLEVEKKEEWVPVTGEERAKRLKEWEAIVKGSTMLSSVPKPSYKELAEEGGLLPPKPAPYPCTSLEEAYIRDRHFEYIKYAYEPRTGQKREGVMTEEEFNQQYNNFNLNKEGL
jgi:hypothetical protein